jgi:site-specific recombinase XerC
MTTIPPPDLAAQLEAFFLEWLRRDRAVSPHTVAAYRDTFRLLLRFVARQLGREPAALAIADFDPPLIAAFLDHLEQE